MEQDQQITLEKIYTIMQKMQRDLRIIEEKLDWEHEFTEEENKEFIEGTRKAWREIDEGNGKKTTVDEFLDEIMALKENA